MIFKAVNGVFLLLFLASAGVQYNDPDPLLWIALYGGAATACLLSFTNWPHLWLLWALVVGPALGAVYLAAGLYGSVAFESVWASMNMESVGIERAREAGDCC